MFIWQYHDFGRENFTKGDNTKIQSVQNIIYKAYVVIGQLRWDFFTFFVWRKEKIATGPVVVFPCYSFFNPFPQEKQRRSSTVHDEKMDDVFCILNTFTACSPAGG